MEIAIAICVEAFANHSAVHHNVDFAYEISPGNVPERLDGGLAIGIEFDRLGSSSGWANCVKLHVLGGAMISGRGTVDVEESGSLYIAVTKVRNLNLCIAHKVDPDVRPFINGDVSFDVAVDHN